MPRGSFLCVVVLLLGSCCLTATWSPSLSLAAGTPDDKDALLDGLLARESLIRTGTFVFQHASMVIKDDGDGGPWPWEKGETPYTAELTIAGKEWVLRWPTTPLVSMHRSDFSATYTETPQPNGQETYRSLILTDPAGVHKSLEEECDGDLKFCIPKAGTLPSAKISRFMEDNRDKIEHVGEETIAGIVTQKLQIRLSTKEFSKILRGLHPRYLKHDTMVMTFYVAPTRNYSAIRIEYSTPDGYVTKRYECQDFTEVAKGIFFPRCYLDMSNFSDAGNGYYVHQYLVSDVRKVNEAVPESSFRMDIPAGARVRDSRPGKGDHVFHLNQGVSFSQADELLRASLDPPRRE
jgi:hypothetical protein